MLGRPTRHRGSEPSVKNTTTQTDARTAIGQVDAGPSRSRNCWGRRARHAAENPAQTQKPISSTNTAANGTPIASISRRLRPNRATGAFTGAS